MGEKTSADVGVIGLAVMGQNLALNMADHGFKVAVFNRTTQVMRRFVAQHPDTPGGLVGCEVLTDLVAAVKTPRKILLLVQAGPAVDAVVQQLCDAGIARDDLVVDAPRRRAPCNVWLDVASPLGAHHGHHGMRPMLPCTDLRPYSAPARDPARRGKHLGEQWKHAATHRAELQVALK